MLGDHEPYFKDLDGMCGVHWIQGVSRPTFAISNSGKISIKRGFHFAHASIMGVFVFFPYISTCNRLITVSFAFSLKGHVQVKQIVVFPRS